MINYLKFSFLARLESRWWPLLTSQPWSGAGLSGPEPGQAKTSSTTYDVITLTVKYFRDIIHKHVIVACSAVCGYAQQSWRQLSMAVVLLCAQIKRDPARGDQG